MKYRADIDGLRAVAVIMVVLFHAGFSIFESGFIGVDIFFVISGFLISMIIKTGLESGNFSFKDFYLKRLWRLMPAMLAMISIALIIASVFYLPPDYASFLKSIKKTMLFVSNKYFGDETTAYAADDSNSLLLLHTWSLSIEWQFYIAFPLAFYFINRKFKATIVKSILTIFIAAAVLLTFHYKFAHPTKTYYFFASRLFEFLFGTMVALNINLANNIKKFYLEALSFIAVIALAIISIKQEVIQGYPNVYTVIVCFAAATLILTGANSDNTINNVLALKPLAWIGSISYSLYLFHWPVFAALNYIGFYDLHHRIIGLSVSILLAVISYYLVEKPLRKPSLTLGRSIFALSLVPFAIIVTFTTVSKRYDEFSYFRFGSELSRINNVLKSSNIKKRQNCMNENVSGTDASCVVGDKKSQTYALVMGDSHSNQYWNFFDIMGKDAHVAVDMKATSLCLAIPNIFHTDMYLGKGDYYKTCHDNVAQYYEAIAQKKYKFVIISQVWPNYANFNVRTKISTVNDNQASIKEINHALDEGIRKIVEAGSTPILVDTMFPMPQNYLTCFYEHFKTREDYLVQECNSNPNFARNTWVNKMFDDLKSKYPSLRIIDPKNVQCSNGLCMTESNGIPLYRDVGHLNDYAASFIGEEYLKHFGNPIKDTK
ncbi:acyltransferase [Salmonella enterica]|nr:acyltransferase [Salmonella enterica]